MARKSESPLHGILLVDKPAGWTSHDVVAKVRRLTGQRRIGHTGTLDPAATGLLVLCLGQATRLVEYITAHDKRYTGEIALGTATTTDDAEGEIISSRPVPVVSTDALAALTRRFTGVLHQVPPAFSAVSVDGQRSYAVARKGATLDLPARPVTIHNLQLTAVAPDRLRIDAHCGAGTYIRSLARDIGAELGCGGHLATLRRLASGSFRLEDAWSLDEIERVSAAGRIDEVLLPADEGMTAFDAAILGADGIAELSFGRMYMPATPVIRACEVARLYTADGAFKGVASLSNSGEIRPLKLLNLPNSG